MLSYDFGYPSKAFPFHLGLYQPILNRFLLVINNIEVAQEIVYIASSRYALYICDLTTAKNYSQNLVDNSCCQNWSTNNHKLIPISDIYQHRTPILTSDLLVEVGPSLEFDIDTEQQWLSFLTGHLKTLQDARAGYKWFGAQEFLCDIMDIKFNCMFDNTNEAMRQIRKELYLSRDINVSKSVIQQIIKNNAILRRYYRV